MAVQVRQLVVVNPEAGVDAVLADLLRMELPEHFADQVAVAGVHVLSEPGSDIDRLARGGRVFRRSELQALMENAFVSDGWFFVGAPGQIGEAVEPVNVPQLLARSAFVIDVLDGRFLAVRTMIPLVAQAALDLIVGVEEIDSCDLEQVRLAY